MCSFRNEQKRFNMRNWVRLTSRYAMWSRTCKRVKPKKRHSHTLNMRKGRCRDCRLPTHNNIKWLFWWWCGNGDDDGGSGNAVRLQTTALLEWETVSSVRRLFLVVAICLHFARCMHITGAMIKQCWYMCAATCGRFAVGR